MSRAIGRRLSTTILAVLLTAAPVAAEPHQGESPTPKRERPAVLVPLYVTFAGLQALDAHSTMTALDAGGREANPVVRSALGSPAGMFLLKSSTAAGVVLLTEKLWPRNRTAAVLTMIALNSTYATIAAHNYSAAQRR